jgi:hypothetical protein
MTWRSWIVGLLLIVKLEGDVKSKVTSEVSEKGIPYWAEQSDRQVVEQPHALYQVIKAARIQG